ncbi:methionyl-tRNA synthetase [Catenaria anguillulae PL171]|uniref:methionine--tRNA ligase n=1 Tax=Catenaria anguillulae PL171 TaxID=765915 RepID=A0A1Y2HMP7_9FUNG|nr:methionyl-tRNA synthetase [Catenaria anguillulae PL171]
MTIPTYHRPTAVPLPDPARKNVLITSALPYVNNEPHLGNIIGCVLSADAYARFARLRGHNTLYVCGTDEYGTATETKALEEGVSCQQLCDKYHVLHRDIYKLFDIDFDKFGRTTTPQQTEIAQAIFNKLHANNRLVTQSMVQLYCEKCSRFLADRYVEGTCPHCKYDDARGDQCDACQKLLNAGDLINPRCKLDGNRPVERESTHLFLDLPNLQAELTEFVDAKSAEGKWSPNSIAVTRAWLKEGLKPRCITRDLKWGTPVPLKGFEDKVFYVWFDAPIGYPSITATLTPEWEAWWKNPEHVQLYQFMGKDNIPFHTVIFPSSLLGTGEKWTLLHHLSTTEYLNYEGGKFSKSRKTGVFGSNVRDTGIDVSVWRYYLFANRPESNDSDFSWKEFIQRNNSELLNNVGNFVNRVTKFVASPKYASTVPEYAWAAHPTDAQLVTDVSALVTQYLDAMDAVKLRLGLQLAMAISARGNQYLQDNKLDNALHASDPERCNNVVAHALNLCYLLAAVFYPFMPGTSRGILRQLQLDQPMFTDKFDQGVFAGHTIGKPEYLFKRLDEKLEAEFRAKYGGQSAGSSPSDAPAAGAAKPAVSKRAALKAAAAQDPIKLLAKVDPAKVTDAVRELQAAVAKQGERVKQLKTSEGGDHKDTKEAVEVLLKFKEDLLREVKAIIEADK